jgi:exonuclease III
MGLRIWSWNVNGVDVWEDVAASGVDVALLQESRQPPDWWPQAVAPCLDGAEQWRTVGWGEGHWARRTAVVQVSDVQITPLPLTTLDDRTEGALPVSRPGTLAAAKVSVDGEDITLVSVYAGWETSTDGRELIYADAAAHRLLSDLAALIATESQHRLIIAGDLNILNGYGEHGARYWAARYSSVFDRAQAMGLSYCGPRSPNGRQALPVPDELPEGSLDVPTYHTHGQGPMGATRQLDFVFCSTPLAERVRASALNRDLQEWGPSDHSRILIELDA